MNVFRLASIAMLSVCAVGYAQSSDKPTTLADAQKSTVKPDASSDAQRSFDLLKTLAGTWKDSITTDNAAWSTD